MNCYRKWIKKNSYLCKLYWNYQEETGIHTVGWCRIYRNWQKADHIQMWKLWWRWRWHWPSLKWVLRTGLRDCDADIEWRYVYIYININMNDMSRIINVSNIMSAQNISIKPGYVWGTSVENDAEWRARLLRGQWAGIIFCLADLIRVKFPRLNELDKRSFVLWSICINPDWET